MQHLVDDLQGYVPELRGRLQHDIDLSSMTWFRVGGPAEVLFVPADEADLCYFLRHVPEHIPVRAIGLGSNVLVRDGGVRGVVIRLPKSFASMELRENGCLRLGAGAHNVKVAKFAADRGIAGFEFLSGIPGSIGGALRMNCGAYGSEIKDRLIVSRVLTRSGEEIALSNEDMGFSYRRCAVPQDLIFVEGLFQGGLSTSEAVWDDMKRMLAARSASQPAKVRTGGSTFKNPDGHKAWELIDRAGCRGLSLGGAQVSDIHCNFLMNLAGATATDIETLGEHIRDCVRETQGVDLEWEIERIGHPGKRSRHS